MRVTRRGWWLGLGIVACARASAPPGPAPEVAIPPPGSEAPPGTTAVQPAASEAGVARCGDDRCDLDGEVCCSNGEARGCIGLVPLDPGEEFPGRLVPQLAACESRVRGDDSFHTIEYCDDSSDCPRGQACCSGTLWSDGSYSACLPLGPDGSSRCELAERCLEGLPCATAGSVCRHGACARATVDLGCGAARCTASAPICCHEADGASSCVAYGDERCSPERGRFPMECRSPADCPPGLVCCSGYGTTYCAGTCINCGLACVTDADCPAEHEGFRLQGCVPTEPDQRPPHRFCSFQ